MRFSEYRFVNIALGGLRMKHAVLLKIKFTIFLLYLTENFKIL